MRRRPRVLLVEDNPADVRLLTEALVEIEFDVELMISRDGEDALAMLRLASLELPDLIVLDLNLPRMDGRQLLAAIRRDSELSELAVVILSTSHYEGDVRACQQLLSRAYVIKPTGFAEFVGVARRLAVLCSEVGQA